VKDLGPDRVISHYRHLPDAVEMLLAAGSRVGMA
jgi:hypothetical protein